MQPLTTILGDINTDYPIGDIYSLEITAVIKIETTGFTAKNSILYLIGCGYYDDGSWKTAQWFAESPEGERELLVSFFEFIGRFKYLFHFNGNNFDLPFILDKCREYRLPYSFDEFSGIDLYKRTVPLQKFLHLSNCKQKTIERFLGTKNADIPEGEKQLVMYHDYLENPAATSKESILGRNREDIKSIIGLFPMVGYYGIFSEDIDVIKVQARSYKDINGLSHRELFMKLELPSPIAKEISSYFNGVYFTAGGRIGAIKVPVYEGELKYFYSNYEDYYYLPDEDTAIHKSIATYAAKQHREQAKASTCYTRKESSYLPEWTALIRPIFKKSYKDKECFFEITPELKKDRKAFKQYAIHLLSLMKDSDACEV